MRLLLFLMIIFQNQPDQELKASSPVFHFTQEKEPSTLTDPQSCSEAACSIPLFHLVDTLYTLNQTGELVLSGASGHQVFEEGLIHIFEIRKNARWHDGKPVLAQHYANGIRRLADPKTASNLAFLVERLHLKNAQSVLKNKKPVSHLGVNVLSDRLLLFKLERPCPHLAHILSLVNFSPYRKDLIQNLEDKKFQVLGSGPFELHVLNPKQNVYELRKFDQFHQAYGKLGNISVIRNEGISSDPQSELQRYQTKEIDLLVVRTENFSQALEKQNQIQVAPTALYHLEVNLRKNRLFSDPDLRKALYYGLNREHLVNKVIGLPGFKSAYGFVPSYITTKKGETYQNFSQIPRKNQIKKAQYYLKTYFKKTKTDSLPALHLICGHQGSLKQQCNYLQNQMHQLFQTKIILDPLPFSLSRKRLKEGNFDMAFIAWVPDYHSPESFLSVYQKDSYANYAGYQNEAYDQKLNEASRQLLEEESFKLYSEAEKKLILKDAVTIPCYEGASLFATRAHFKNLIRRNIATEFDFRFLTYEQDLLSNK